MGKPQAKKQTKNSVYETGLQPVWRTDSRPDPSVLTEQQRLHEFGKLMFRAVERRRAHADGSNRTPAHQ